MTQSADRVEEKPKESLADILRTIVYALLIALVFRTVLFQPFSIPSGSMKSTLLIGDYLFVSKYSYGYSKYSLPLGSYIPDALWPGRLFGSEPERGDVIVFRNPNDVENDYIKRVIGLPGDRVRVRGGVVELNGAPLPQTPDGVFEEPRQAPGSSQTQLCRRGLGDAQTCVNERAIETLPSGLTHTVLNADENRGYGDNTCEYTVPSGHYLFMGDNRDNSLDGRFNVDPAYVKCDDGRRAPGSSGPGLVPAQMLIGRAEIILLSSAGEFWEPWRWRADRFFEWVQ